MIKEKSHNRRLVDYFKNNAKKGYSIDSLKWALINQKNSKIEVEKALDVAKKEIEHEQFLDKKLSVEQVPKIEMPQLETEPEKVSFWKRLFG